jgi:hypothetical protein
MTNARTLTRDLGGRWHGSYGTARCPAHDDRSTSLSIRDGNTGPLLKCHGGCDSGDVFQALRDRGLIGGRAAVPSPSFPPSHSAPLADGGTRTYSPIAYGNQPAGLRAWQPPANNGPSSSTRYPRVTRKRQNVLLLQFMQ